LHSDHKHVNRLTRVFLEATVPAVRFDNPVTGGSSEGPVDVARAPRNADSPPER